MAHNYRELETFHLSYDFVIRLYHFLDKFPESEHQNLVLQMKRAAVSMPMNIAEGSSRRTPREFLVFLIYSLGSGKELEVSLRLSKDLGFLDGKVYADLQERLQTFMTKLSSLIKYYETKTPPRKERVISQIERGEFPWKQQEMPRQKSSASSPGLS